VSRLPERAGKLPFLGLVAPLDRGWQRMSSEPQFDHTGVERATRPVRSSTVRATSATKIKFPRNLSNRLETHLSHCKNLQPFSPAILKSSGACHVGEQFCGLSLCRVVVSRRPLAHDGLPKRMATGDHMPPIHGNFSIRAFIYLFSFLFCITALQKTERRRVDKLAVFGKIFSSDRGPEKNEQ
jgi:hypothetical protein